MTIVQNTIAWIWVSVGLIAFGGQLISAINFELAQRLGLQEKGENVDQMHSTLEKMTARWDVFVLWTAPAAAMFYLLGHTEWPLFFVIAGTVYLDAGGREWAKILGLRTHGKPMGTTIDLFKIYGTYLYLGLTGIIGLAVGLIAMA